MRLYIKEEVDLHRERLLYDLENTVFIHPTDTIYGLGCNATDKQLVQKIRDIKKRQDLPFSIIAPSKKWIYQNCNVTRQGSQWVEKLPGPYTLILKLKNKNAIASNVNNDMPTLGVRIPKHWFSEVVYELGFPVVTTSANISGDDFMTSVDNLNNDIKHKVDFILYEGEKKANPSQLIDLTKEKISITKRK
jgi:tRNA threonylcarbamoyl adenosine modification protein (Sua5/YciO/YrdC/YwlC family)